METLNIKDYLGNLPRFIADKKDTVVVYNDKPCVLYGADEFNESYCRDNSIPIYHTHTFGATIVDFAGDICVGNYQSDFNDFGIDLLVKIVEWLKTKNLNATLIGNEVLIDETYKVASFMSQYIDGCLYTGIHISVNCDSSLVNTICTTKRYTIPKGLTDYGITEQEVNKFVLDTLGQN